MDPIGAAATNRNKKRRASSDEAPKVQDYAMTSYHSSFPPTCFGAVFEHMVARWWPQIKEPVMGEVLNRIFVETWPKMEHEFRQQVSKEIERMMISRIYSLSPSPSEQHESEEGEVPTTSKTLKLKLCFSNSISPLIFTNNEIKSEHGEPLKVLIHDATNSNTIISTGPSSSALVEFFILGEFDSSKRQDDETPWTSSDFDKSILTPRDGKRPLIIGSDRQLYLQNGVGFVKNLIVTDNSSWMKSKMFRLGARIKDEKSQVQFGRIGEAVSRPFRVMDQRGEGNQKHHPPRREDEIWRLEGISKDGIYHKNLSSQGIKTVGDFLKAYQKNNNPTTLRMMLGKRVLDKTWNMMVKNAEECIVDNVPINDDRTVQANNLAEINQVMGDEAFQGNFGFMQNNFGESNDLPRLRINEGLLDSVVNYRGLRC
ncbi:calmodulin-binding protein 60 G-like isoform X2 [Benincasa hispida]|uniref:calmodulin-binding protein 60 G-like isoform X2 n=1 Tax=Benincasa hispida TaxID=102211 RepID=UPI0019011C25|nr:calmodulin-binding protein 60 G-like isoform X2 [Benincasa hispida]